MKDGLVLMYVKNDTIYPVMLTNEQQEVFELLQGTLPQPIRVAGNMPQGKAVNLASKAVEPCKESQ